MPKTLFASFLLNTINFLHYLDVALIAFPTQSGNLRDFIMKFKTWAKLILANSIFILSGKLFLKPYKSALKAYQTFSLKSWKTFLPTVQNFCAVKNASNNGYKKVKKISKDFLNFCVNQMSKYQKVTKIIQKTFENPFRNRK